MNHLLFYGDTATESSLWPTTFDWGSSLRQYMYQSSEAREIRFAINTIVLYIRSTFKYLVNSAPNTKTNFREHKKMHIYHSYCGRLRYCYVKQFTVETQ